MDSQLLDFVPLLIVVALVCIGKVNTSLKKAKQRLFYQLPRTSAPRQQSIVPRGAVVDVDHFSAAASSGSRRSASLLPQDSASRTQTATPSQPLSAAPRRVEGERVTTDPPSRLRQSAHRPAATSHSPLAGFNLRQAVIWSEIMRPRFKDV